MTQDYYGTKRITAWPERKPIRKENCEAELVEGYAVKYSDGYISWSPKAVFEEAYQPLTALSFEHALFAAKRGYGIRLPHWKEDVVVRVQNPDEHRKMTHPYLYVESRFGRVPWKETVVEMFANNWQIVE
jgi:hypothetical protein